MWSKEDEEVRLYAFRMAIVRCCSIKRSWSWHPAPTLARLHRQVVLFASDLWRSEVKCLYRSYDAPLDPCVAAVAAAWIPLSSFGPLTGLEGYSGRLGSLLAVGSWFHGSVRGVGLSQFCLGG